MNVKLKYVALAALWTTLSLADVNTITLKPGSSATINAAVTTNVTCAQPGVPLDWDTYADSGVQEYSVTNDCSKILPSFKTDSPIRGTAITHITCGPITYVVVAWDQGASAVAFNLTDVFTVPPPPVH